MIVISAEWVLPITKKPIFKGSVAVKHGEIIDVGHTVDILAKYPQAKIREIKNAVLMPGLVNCHSHLDQAVLRGMFFDYSYVDWKLEQLKKSRDLTDGDIEVSALLGTIRALGSGVTTVADTSEHPHSLRAAKKLGLRGVFSLEVSGIDANRNKKVFDNTQNNFAAWQSDAKDSLCKVGIAPHSTYTISPDLLEMISGWAKQEKIPITIHLAGSKDEYEFIKYGSSRLATEFWHMMGWDDNLWQPMGVSPVKYLEQWGVFDAEVVGVHCIHVDTADIEILKKYAVKIAYCPKMSAKLGLGIPPLEQFKKRGLMVGIGNDSPASSDILDFFDELRIGLMIQRAVSSNIELFSAENFIRMATIEGAQILGLGDKIGSLEKGKRADVIAIRLPEPINVSLENPYATLVYNASARDVNYVMVDGREVMIDNVLVDVDQADLNAKLEKVKLKLSGSHHK